MPFYRIQVECEYSWADAIWVWRVLDKKDEVVWHGTSMCRWTGKLAAKRAAKKHSRGKRMDGNNTDKIDMNVWVP